MFITTSQTHCDELIQEQFEQFINIQISVLEASL